MKASLSASYTAFRCFRLPRAQRIAEFLSTIACLLIFASLTSAQVMYEESVDPFTDEVTGRVLIVSAYNPDYSQGVLLLGCHEDSNDFVVAFGPQDNIVFTNTLTFRYRFDSNKPVTVFASGTSDKTAMLIRDALRFADQAVISEKVIVGIQGQDAEYVYEFFLDSLDEKLNRLSCYSSPNIANEKTPLKFQSATSDSEVTDFANTYLLRTATGDLASISELYAGEVTYYDWGATPLHKVLEDKVSYFNRWTTRQYSQVSNVLVTELPSTWEVTFDYDYTVFNTDEQRNGKAFAKLQITMVDGKLIITGESGGIY